MIWKIETSPEIVNEGNKNTMMSHLGIKVTTIGEDYIKAELKVDEKTIQPWGIMNGGVSAVLSESVGSIASSLCVDLSQSRPVGVEVNVNHLKAIPQGSLITAECRPIRVGRKMHVWQTRILNEKEELCAISRLTVMIIPV